MCKGFFLANIVDLNYSNYLLVLQIFRNLHMLYTDAVCNPFYIPGEQLTFKYALN